MTNTPDNPSTKENEMTEINIAAHKQIAGAWTVETILGDGAIEQAIFAGPDAEKRATAYHSWISNQ